MRMLKKIFFLVLVLVLLPNDVFAITVDGFYAQINDKTKFSSLYANQIVHIEKLYFNDDIVEVSGYSFIPYQDNYGGEGGNIKTYVVAVNAPSTGMVWNEWGNATLDIAPSDGSIKCKDTSNCYVMKTEVEKRDFWWARCTGDGCANQKIITDYRLGEYNGGITQFNNTVTCASSKVNIGGVLYESECIYYDVGFSLKFDLNKLIDQFKKTTAVDEINMRFFIVTLNTDVLKHRNKPGIGATYTEMYVPEENCFYKDSNGNGVKCADGESTDENGFVSGSVNTSSFSFGLKYKTTQLAFNARNATPLTDDYSSVDKNNYYFYNKSFNSYFENYELLNQYGYTAWFTGDPYNISEYTPNGSQENEFIRSVNGASGSFNDALYKLHTFNNNNCDQIKEIIRDNKDNIVTKIENMFGGDANQACVNANYDSNGDKVWDEQPNIEYWAYANWVNIRGSFQISGIKEKIKVKCENLYGDGSEDIKYYTSIDNNKVIQDSNVDCNVSDDKNVTIEQCSDNDNEGHSVQGTIYVKIDGSTGADCVGGGVVNDFVPINISTNVLFHQTGYFRFNKITDDTIRAGKGFELVSSYGHDEKENNTLTYDALLEWDYFTWYKSDGKMYPYYDVTTDYDEKTVDGCINVNPYKLLNNTTEFYYDNSTRAEATTLEDAIFNAIDIAVQNRYYASDATETINENVTFSSGDSNAKTVSKSTELVTVAGRWEELKKNPGSRYFIFDNNSVVSSTSGGVKSGNASYFSYVYTLPNAYISLVEEGIYNYADILYTNDASVDTSKFYSVGNKYFVGLKYIDNEFPFKLIDVNPSLISEMAWELNGSCSVKVDNGLFDDDGKPSYKYRSISLSNPFPKAEKNNGILVNVATNWKDWYNNNINGSGTFSRFINTYDNGINYQIIMTKVDDSDANTISINEIKNISDYYGKLTGFSSYGTSKFVTSNGFTSGDFSIVRGNNGYCRLGFFSNDCDVYGKTESNYAK